MRNAYYAAGAVVIAGAIAAYTWTSRQPETILARNWQMLDAYCVECHNDTEFTGGMSLEGISLDDIHANAALFEEIRRRLKLGVMPPRDGPQPDAEVRVEFVNALTETLDAAAFAEPYASSTKVHRLNRAEYANAIRDLFGIEADLTALLPSDGGDFGFDNIADLLTTSPLLLERYLAVALQVTDMAMGNPDAQPARVSYNIPFDTTQDYHLEGLPLGTRGGIEVTHYFPADGQYVFGGRLMRGVEEGLFGVEGHDRPHEFLVLLDDEIVHTAQIGGPEDHQVSLDEGFNTLQFDIDPRLTSPPISVTAGPHTLAMTWRERTGVDQSVWERVDRASLEIHNPSGMPRIEFAYLEGPFDVTGVSGTPTRDRIFVCEPASQADEAACAEEIVAALAKRAFRRPVTAEDIASPLAFYEDERALGGDFDAGIRAAVSRILVSPWFLFRSESESPDVPPGSAHSISDIELASRLSFFLWSSIPDEELLEAAEQGRLSEPAVLEAQVRRMIADSRSDALVDNFTGQWLQLRNLDSRVRPDLLLFPDFDDNLRQAMRRETESLFAHVLREDLPVHELMTASYTFLNERLARHYGIDGVYGQRFRRVELEDPNRWGLFGHGSILSLTSQGTRTSPIVRGKFLVSEFWNNPPPAPPDEVPDLEESAPEGRPTTVRELLELHRANPACASCHDNIDPVGFALENFNAVGQWREVDRQGLEIDSAGTLADGTIVNGPAELREALLADPELFAGTVTEKLLIYALGRGLEPADMPVIRQIVRNSAVHNFSLDAILLGIIDSYPFQMRRNLSENDGTVTIATSGEQ